MKNYLTGIQHIGIPTLDMDKTIEFYKKLGFDIAYETVLDGDRVVFFKLGNLVIESYDDSAATMKTGAVDHIAIDVTDIDKAYAQVKDAGLEIMDEIEFLPFWDNGVKFFKIEGPNKEIIEFSQML